MFKEKVESIDQKEMAVGSGTEKPVAVKHKGQPSP